MDNNPPILKSKLRVPRAPSRWLSRSHLLDELQKATEYRLVLISAPAGYGKTSVLGEWARERPEQVSWIALDENDDDPNRVLSLLREGLKRIAPTLADLDDTLQAYPTAPVSTGVGLLLNEIEMEEDDFYIVLEDVHLIRNPSVHELLSYLIRYLPPRLHLVLSTRIDPPLDLDRYRAQNQMMEIRQQDLSFSATEISSLLNEIMGLDLAEAETEVLAERTEGWIAGVQIAALALSKSDSRGDFIRGFKGNHSYVVNYLAKEVLFHQPPEIRTFLVRTSVLEHLSADLCNEVTGRDDSIDILERLVSENQFIVQLDDQRHWYRYHHLFSEALRSVQQKEMPDQLLDIYERAANWYHRQGFRGEAIEYSLKTGNTSRVVNLMESYAKVVLQEGERSNVRRWIHHLDEKTVGERPLLGLIHAWSIMNDKTSVSDQTFAKRLDDAERLLQQSGCAANENLSDPFFSKENLLGVITILRAIFAFERGEPSTIYLKGLEQSLHHSEGEINEVHSAVHFLMGHIQLRAVDLDAAYHSLDEAESTAEALGQHYLSVYATYLKAWIFFQQGKYHQALHLCDSCLRQTEFEGSQQRSRPKLIDALRIIKGAVHLEWNQPSEANREVDLAMRSLQPSSEVGILINGLAVQISAKLAIGESEENIRPMITRLVSMTRYHPAVETLSQALEMQLSFQAGAGALELEEIVNLEEKLKTGLLSFEDELPYYQIFVWQLKARLLLIRMVLHQQADKKRVVAPSLFSTIKNYLKHQLTGVNRWGLNQLKTELLVVLSMVSELDSDQEEADSTLRDAIRTAFNQSALRSFVENGEILMEPLKRLGRSGYHQEFIEKVLQRASPVPQPDTGAASGIRESAGRFVEPLSPREREVLQLMAQGNSNRDISSKLFISLNTVKTHTSAIYGKLGVSNRAEAVSVASQLGLL